MKKILLSDKIFVAGAKGMAGSAICRALRKHEYGLNNNGGNLLTPSRQELNLLNYSEVKNWFEINKPTVVIIAAAKVGGILANSTYPAEFILENIKIQTNLIESAWNTGVKRLLFLGSSCIYPKHAEQPIKEEALLTGLPEETNQWYAIAKIAGIKLCESLRIQYGFDAISLMPTNLYGPGDNYHPNNSHVMASLIRKFSEASLQASETVTCWGSGNPLREFLHVDDLAEAVICTLENWDPDSQYLSLPNRDKPIYHLNVGTGKDISINDLARKIAKACEYKGKIFWDKNKPDGTYKKQLNITRIKNLGWSAKIDLDLGIEETVSAFKAKLK